MASPRVEVVAFPRLNLNPLSWLGSEAGKVAADAWTAAMTGLWSAGMWLLEFAFHVIDAFTTPDLSASGPLGAVLPTTLWLAVFTAGMAFFLQIGAALIRRDGQSLGRVLAGIAQFGLVWAGYLTVAAAAVVAAGALTKGILHALLGVDSFAQFGVDASWPRKVDDAVVATVLGVLAMLLVIPGAFFHLVIMLTRSAGLIVLAATSPISAAGLLADVSKGWFWKTLRWFLACVLIQPLAALVLGIGHQLTAGVVSGVGDKTVAAVGMAVVGAVLVAVSSVCPLILFRLLAFVDPGTASGAALRQSWTDAGGLSGVLGGGLGGGAQGGSSAAAEGAADGRSAGESAAESQSGSRVMAAFGMVGQGMTTAARMGQKAADLGSDVLGQAGVGHPGYAMGFADEALMRRRSSSGGEGSRSGGGTPGEDDPSTPGGGGGGGGGESPAPDPMPAPTPASAAPGGGSMPTGPVPGGPGAGGAGAAGAGASEGAAAAALRRRRCEGRAGPLRRLGAGPPRLVHGAVGGRLGAGAGGWDAAAAGGGRAPLGLRRWGGSRCGARPWRWSRFRCAAGPRCAGR